MISYGKQSIDQTDINAVLKVLKGDWLTQGPAVDIYENSLKDYFGSNHACVVSNGTAALHLTGLALGWQNEDVIITTPITFLATVNSIIYAGATPDFVDIDPITYTIDPQQVEKKVKFYQSKGKKVKAVIGVDFAGHPCNWKSLRTLADKYGFQLVNDNCHALGAEYYGNKQYAVKYADVVTQSYHPVKHITTGEGGAILTNDSKIDQKVRLLRSHGMIKDPELLEKNDGPWYYEMHEIGYNYRITDFQCALGITQLKKLNSFINKRFEVAKKYDEHFNENGLLKIPESESFVNHSYHLYPLQIDFDKSNIDKLAFFNKMKQSGINLQVHYIPVHLQPFYKKNYAFNQGDFPISEDCYHRMVSLPIYPSLRSNEVHLVISKTKELLKIINE